MEQQARKYLGARVGEQVAVSAVLPCGLSLSPYVFTRYTNWLAGLVRRKTGLHIAVYIDDFIVGAASKDKLEEGLKVLRELFAELGVVLSEKKTSVIAREAEFLGFHWSATDKTVGIAEDKRKEYMRALKNLLRSPQPVHRCGGLLESLYFSRRPLGQRWTCAKPDEIDSRETVNSKGTAIGRGKRRLKLVVRDPAQQEVNELEDNGGDSNNIHGCLGREDWLHIGTWRANTQRNAASWEQREPHKHKRIGGSPEMHRGEQGTLEGQKGSLVLRQYHGQSSNSKTRDTEDWAGNMGSNKENNRHNGRIQHQFNPEARTRCAQQSCKRIIPSWAERGAMARSIKTCYRALGSTRARPVRLCERILEALGKLVLGKWKSIIKAQD